MNAIHALENIDRCEPDHTVPLRLQVVCSAAVMTDRFVSCVLTTINLDDQFDRVRGKINIVQPDGNLAPKMGRAKRVSPQQDPKPGFRRGHPSALRTSLS